MSQISEKSEVYTCLDYNLAAAFSVNQADFHPDSPDGIGQIDMISNTRGARRGWMFKIKTRQGISLGALERGWNEPQAAQDFADAIMEVPGAQGEKLQRLFAPAVMHWLHQYHWAKTRFHARVTGERVPWVQIDKGGTRSIFKKDDEKSRKWLGIR